MGSRGAPQLDHWTISPNEKFRPSMDANFLPGVKHLELSWEFKGREKARCAWRSIGVDISFLSKAMPFVRQLTIDCCGRGSPHKCFAVSVIKSLPYVDKVLCFIPTEDSKYRSHSKGLHRLREFMALSVKRFEAVHISLHPEYFRGSCTSSNEHPCAVSHADMAGALRSPKPVRVFVMISMHATERGDVLQTSLGDVLELLPVLLRDATFLVTLTLHGMLLPRHYMIAILSAIGRNIHTLSIDPHCQEGTSDDFLSMLMLDAARFAPALRIIWVELKFLTHEFAIWREALTDASDWAPDGWRQKRLRKAWNLFCAKVVGVIGIADRANAQRVSWDQLLACYSRIHESHGAVHEAST